MAAGLAESLEPFALVLGRQDAEDLLDNVADRLEETTPGAQARNEILRASRQFGRAIWKNWSGYHRRSLIEAKTRCLKLLGERLSARTANRQTAELQVRAALPNRFTALGTPETQRVA